MVFPFRVYPTLCLAVGNFVINHNEAIGSHQEYYVSFVDICTRLNVRVVTMARIGELVLIFSQVIRTHLVHLEMVSGHFTSIDCQTRYPMLKNILK